jgi:hypothetical protein
LVIGGGSFFSFGSRVKLAISNRFEKRNPRARVFAGCAFRRAFTKSQFKCAISHWIPRVHWLFSPEHSTNSNSAIGEFWI